MLNNGSEACGFSQAKQIKSIHIQFCKHLLGVKTSTQNGFVYVECVWKNWLLYSKALHPSKIFAKSGYI